MQLSSINGYCLIIGKSIAAANIGTVQKINTIGRRMKYVQKKNYLQYTGSKILMKSMISILCEIFFLFSIGYIIGWVLGYRQGIKEAEDRFCDRYLNDEDKSK